MKYSEIVNVYQELEKTRSKLKKSDIISEFLKKSPSSEIEKIVPLLFGKIFSASDKEIGVASQMVIRSIAKSYGIGEKQVVDKFNKSGDLGKTAEEFSKSRKQKILLSKKLTVDKVVENLKKISEQEGKGSQERKISLIVELLSHASSDEARYIVRTILEELRVGVAEGLVRDAIAKAFDVDVKLVEGAWELNPDYGKIAYIAKKKGSSGLEKVSISVEQPIKLQLAEKSPSLEEALKKFENPVLEFKYDGMRTQIHKKGNDVKIFTRSLEDVTGAFPDLVDICRKSIKAKDAILDGETVAIHPKSGGPLPFQKLSTRIKRKYDLKKAQEDIPIQINFFDIIHADGKSFMNLSAEDRFKELKKIVEPVKGKVKFVDRLITNNPKKAKEFYNKALVSGHEGLIVKNLNANYVPGRKVAGGWLKVKPTMENLDLVIIGGTWGTGKRTGWIASLILGCRDAKSGKYLECGMMGTGIKEKKTQPEDVTFDEITKMLKPFIEKEKKNKIFIKPKIVIEIAYEEIQKSPTYNSGWALRFPRFIRLRHMEKKPEQADTKGRIEYLYKIQKGKK